MKIVQVAAALPSLIPSVPRLAEGAMLFELSVVSGEGGSGDGAAASGHDAIDSGQYAGNSAVADVLTDIGSMIADSATVRQVSPLPISLPISPPVVEGPRTSVQIAAPAATLAAAEGRRARPVIESVAVSPSTSPTTVGTAGTSADGHASVAESGGDRSGRVMELPDPGARTGVTQTKGAIDARSAPRSHRLIATTSSPMPQPVTSSPGPAIVTEMRGHRPREMTRTASVISPTDVRPIGQGVVEVPDRVAAPLPQPLPASISSIDTVVQPKSPETPLPQPTVADGARRVIVEQITALPGRTIGEITEATPPPPTNELGGAAPMSSASGSEPIPIDARIAPPRLELAVAGRRSNADIPPDPSVDKSPVVVVRQEHGELGLRSLSSRPVVDQRRLQTDVPNGTGMPVSEIGEPGRRNGPARDPAGSQKIWHANLPDIAPTVAPAELVPATSTPILSGMTRSVDAIAANAPATLPVLDVDAGGQWLDRLAVEISACAATGGMRLKLSPDNLGELVIAVTKGDSGASVVITAQDEGVRSAIAGAQDRLIAEARANGLRLADVQTGLAGEGGTGTQQHMRQSPQAAIPDRFNQPKRIMGQEVANHERANPAGRWA